MSFIFVFGSNLLGIHGKGAALTAAKHFDAQHGIGQGLTGRAYALPTKITPYEVLPLDEVEKHVQRFIGFAKERADLSFQVTRVGCGLAQYTDEQIAPMFVNAPPQNVFFDLQWRPYLPKGFEYWGTFS